MSLRSTSIYTSFLVEIDKVHGLEMVHLLDSEDGYLAYKVFIPIVGMTKIIVYLDGGVVVWLTPEYLGNLSCVTVNNGTGQFAALDVKYLQLLIYDRTGWFLEYPKAIANSFWRLSYNLQQACQYVVYQ